MRNKKNQQEIVGFVLIVVIVAIIGLVFLGFSLRKTRPVIRQDIDINYFLQASMKYTTDCAINYEPNYDTIQDLIKSCYENKKCLNGKMACDVLDSSFSEIMRMGWGVGEDRPIKAYELEIYYQEAGEKQEILTLNEGEFVNCSVKKSGEISQRDFNTRLGLCYQD